MMIGDQGVGKTALLVRYTEDDFSESVLPTIGIDFKAKVGGPCRRLDVFCLSLSAAMCLPADGPNWWENSQAADMGHRGTGAGQRG